MRRVIAAASLVAVGVIAVALLASPRALIPAQLADGLQIRTVSEALAIRDRLADTDPIAVRGWLSNGFPHSCPAPMGPDGRFRNPSPLELYCRRGEDVLTELQEAAAVVRIEQLPEGRAVSQQLRPLAGPHLDPVMIGYVTDASIWPPGGETWVPKPIVAVGHFRDHRAAACLPADVAFCLQVFVIDHLPVIGAERHDTARQPIPGLGPPAQTPEIVEERVRQRLGVDITILSTAAYRGADLPAVEDRAPRIPDRAASWLLVVIDRGPDGTAAPRIVSVVVDDASGAIIWSSDAVAS